MTQNELQAELKIMAPRILAAESILLFPHAHMDGDCLGSSAALCRGLRSLGKTCWVVVEDPIPANLRFLDEELCTWNTGILEAPDVCIAVDCAEPERFPRRKELFLKGRETMCIDHHLTAEPFASFNYIDPSAAATGELIYRFLGALGVQMDKAMGEALYTAITTDTGNFQYSNTTRRTHEIVAELYDLGIDHARVSVAIYQNVRLEKLQMFNRSLGSMRTFADGRIAIVSLRQKDLEDTGATSDEAEGIVETVRSIGTVEIAVLLKEMKDQKVKVSLRAKNDFNVARFAARFGGGGHVKAAGFVMTEPVDRCFEILSHELTTELMQEETEDMETEIKGEGGSIL